MTLVNIQTAEFYLVCICMHALEYFSRTVLTPVVGDMSVGKKKNFLECQHTLNLSLLPPCVADSREKKSPAMPGSPVDAKTHSRSAPSSSASSTMPPLPSVNPSGPRPASFSTTACKARSALLLCLEKNLISASGQPIFSRCFFEWSTLSRSANV